MTKWESDDGRVVLYNADCREIIPQVKCDMVLTDAPYRHAHMDGGGFASASRFYAGGAIDFISDFDFAGHSDVLFSAPILVTFCSRDLIRDYGNAAYERGFIFDLHVWHKVNAIPFCCNTFKSDIEYIVVAWKGKKRLAKLPQNEMSKVWRSGRETGDYHPTQKPIGLMEKYLRAFSSCSIIYDPFMGSGTTGIACLRTGRLFIGVELDTSYFEVAVERIKRELAQPYIPALAPARHVEHELWICTNAGNGG